MGSLNSITRRILIGVIAIMLPFIMVSGFDMNTSLLISSGFGTSISLWISSINHESSFIASHIKKN